MTDSINLSADLGEGFGSYKMGDDLAMLDVVSSANVACGFHAGDPRIMRDTVRACTERGVSIGAHPSLPDKVGFGRRRIDCFPDEVYTDTLYQLGALAGFAKAAGAKLSHVTPHGALGKMTRKQRALAGALVHAVRDFDQSLRIVSREGLLTECAAEAGLPIGFSGFADRLYDDDGELAHRSIPGTVITDPVEVVARAVQMVTEGTVQTVSGALRPIRCDSIVVHGDTEGAVRLARAVADGLAEAGITVAPFAAA